MHGAGVFFSVVPSLIVYLAFPANDYLRKESAKALNFQLMMLFAYILASVTMAMIIGLLLLPLFGLSNLVLCIVASIKTSNGEDYNYPFTPSIIKLPDQSASIQTHQPVMQQPATRVSQGKYCSACGGVVTPADVFCGGCGKCL